MSFGIKRSGLRKPARFVMEGVSANPDAPHVLHVHHMGMSNPAVFNALVKGQRPTEIDAIAQLVERGGITWENVAHEDGIPLEPTTENVAAYFAACVDNGYGKQVLDLWTFAYDAKNYAVPAEDPTKLGEAPPPG